MWLLLLSILVYGAIATQETCSGSTTFFVMDNTKLLSTNGSIVYEDTAEEDCMRICERNRDQFNREINCVSFTYDHKAFSCRIYQEKAKPFGIMEQKPSAGMRYFEKICLPDNLPRACDKTQYIRADDSVLVGYASNISLVDTIEQCVVKCVFDSKCKSAMYFYEEGECITNGESAMTKPNSFSKDDTEKVIYFENSCYFALANLESSDEKTKAKASAAEEEQTGSDKKKSKSKIDKAAEEETEYVEEEVEAETEAPKRTTTTTQKPSSTRKSKSRKQIEEDYELAEVPDDDDDESESYEYVEESTESATTTTKAPKAKAQKMKPKARPEEDTEYEESEEVKYKKYTKHPRNFGARTQIMPEKSDQEEYDDYEAQKKEKPHVKEYMEESKEEISMQKRKKPEEHKRQQLKIEKTHSITDDGAQLFSEWSDWTPCTKSGERQIRRRRCLDLRRCLGALMQTRLCPAITSQPRGDFSEESESVESIRSIVDTDGTSLSGHSAINNREEQTQVPIMWQQEPAVSLRVTPPASSSLWTPWTEKCQEFASGQPCNNGKMIGFESRECIANDPSLCVGPFFRYCTLPC